MNMTAQHVWDRMLLHIFIQEFAWSGKYDTKMSSLSRYFHAATGLTVDGLKRSPGRGHMDMTVRRFVCGHLPRLARIILDKEKTHDDVEDLVEKLQRWSIDTLPTDPAHQRDSAYFRREGQAYAFSRLKTAQFAEAIEKANAQVAASGIRTGRRRHA